MGKTSNLFYANFMQKVGLILKNNSVVEDELTILMIIVFKKKKLSYLLVFF